MVFMLMYSPITIAFNMCSHRKSLISDKGGG
ncbi:hypothetical protein MTR67_001388 [Solanum verrucosum]|uniref:Uncharacterized protein n=1 Tax=Solanum verrucosum TaxID=315347 RepID=A0AAF0T8D8_SOLVR|nr:hypothetical protein MTR67_001388 [Solanum verrucosum]